MNEGRHHLMFDDGSPSEFAIGGDRHRCAIGRVDGENILATNRYRFDIGELRNAKLSQLGGCDVADIQNLRENLVIAISAVLTAHDLIFLSADGTSARPVNAQS